MASPTCGMGDIMARPRTKALFRPALLVALLLAVAGVSLGACAQQGSTTQATTQASAQSATTTAAQLATFKADVNGDATVSVPRPQDDYYLSKNLGWLQSVTVDPTKSSVSTFSGLDDVVEERLTQISTSCAASVGDVSPTSDEARVGALYSTAIDMDARDAAGLGAAAPLFSSIGGATTLEEYERAVGSIAGTYELNACIGITSSVSAQRGGIYTACIEDPTIFMDGAYFTSSDSTARDRLKAHLVRMLELYGYSSEKAEHDGAAVYDMVVDLASVALSPDEYYEPSISSNLMGWDELQSLFEGIDLDVLLGAAGCTPATGVDTFDVTSINQAKVLAAYFRPENLDTLKAYSILSLLDGYSPMSSTYSPMLASYLGCDLRDERLSFRNYLDGITQQDSDETLAVSSNNRVLALAYSKLYVARYVDPAAKADVTSIVDSFLASYRAMIQGSSWMTDETKAEALKKIDTMKVQVVSPDAWEAWLDDVELVPADEGGVYIDNVLRVKQAKQAQYLSQIDQPIDPSRWGVSTQSVNAFYNESINGITILAGILQAPMYDASASRASNLGGIGFVIAHELTHAFDASGSQYDSTGALRDWWTDADREKFEQVMAKFITFYNRYEVGDGIYANGERTLTENMADCGGMKCVVNVIAEECGVDPNDPQSAAGEARDRYRAALDGAFSSLAEFWKTKYTSASLVYYRDVDVHSLPYLRVDGVLSATDAFYYLYDLQEGDGMYVTPEARPSIW